MVDVRRALAVRSQAAGAALLRPLRRGHRTVIWAPGEGLGFGNFLYLWLHAYVRQHHGDDYRVLLPPVMESWTDLLPELRRSLAVTQDEVRFSDRREPWTFDLRGRFGIDFTREELHSFVGQMLVGTPLLNGQGAETDVVTVNVRRGDYYSKPHFRGTYGFDIPAYLDVALGEATASGGTIGRIRVVSDGLDWCRTKLGGTLRGHADVVEYVPASDSPQDNFRSIATSHRLVGTNSTFSYWGGYVSNVVHGSASQVVMPRFHARLGKDHSAYQLDPAWTIVENVPGGWDG